MTTQRVDDNNGAVVPDGTGIQVVINFDDGTAKVFDFTDWSGTRPGWLDGTAGGKKIAALFIRDLAVALPRRPNRPSRTGGA